MNPDEKKRKQVARALAIVRMAANLLEKQNPGGPPIMSLTDIEGYQDAASHVVHFVLNPRDYVDASGAPIAAVKHARMLYAVLKEVHDEMIPDEWAPPLVERIEKALAVGEPSE